MVMTQIGRLKRTTSDKCPRCNRPLQIRILSRPSISDDGEEIESNFEYIRCSNLSCEYETNSSKDRKTKKHKKEVRDEW